MRIDLLDLRAFGHFTDKSIIFPRNAGLNIVFGPNEAGKSTTMRALDNFFFGFGLKSADAFVHDYKDLAVRAVLETDSGKLLDLTRFKRNKNDLLDDQGSPVDPGIMPAIMGGMDREMYANMFGLDHFSLRQGAQEILTGGGHLGQTLFAAASGVTHLRRVQEDLQEKCDKLFRPRATSKPVWQHAVKISDLNKKIRDLSVKPDEWRALKNSLEQIQKDKQSLKEELHNIQASLNRHKRYHNALHHISAYNDLSARLTELGSIPELNPDFAEKRIKILFTINQLTSEITEQTRIENKISQELDQLQTCKQTLGFAQEVQQLFNQAGVIVEARESITSLELEISELNGVIQEKSGLLQDSALPDNPDILPVSPGKLKKIETLAGELGLLKSKLDQAETDIKKHEKDLEFVSSQLAEMPPAPDSKKLEILARKMSVAPELLKQESRSKTRIKKLERGIEKSINSLGLWQGDVKSLADLSLPLTETIDTYEQDISAARQELKLAEEKLQELEEHLESRQETLSGLDPDQSIPEPDTLSRARSLRDQGWKLIKSAWLDGAESEPQTQTFLEQTNSVDLAHGFEKTLTGADQTADILLEKADQVAAKQALIREIQGLEEKKHHLEMTVRSSSENYSQVMRKWRELWSKADISPLSPREMTAWMSRVKDILRLGEELENEKFELQNIQENIDQLAGLGAQTLAGEGADISADADITTLCALMDDARDKALEIISTRKNLKRDQDKVKRTLKDLLARQTDLKQELETRKNQWNEILTSSNLEPDRDPRDILEEIRIRHEIHANLTQLDKLRNRKQALEKKCREYAGQVTRLAAALKYREKDPAGPEDIARRLYIHLSSEQKKADRKQHLQERLREARDKAEKNRAELAVQEGKIKIICQEAGTDDPAKLPAIEEKSALKKELRTKLEHCLDNLRQLSAGEDLKTFMDQAGSFDPDELQEIISALEKEISEKTPRMEQLIRDEVELELSLDKMDGTSQVPELEQQIQEQRAMLEDNVQEYVHLKLAVFILAAEIERYRTANQGPVLKTAGDIFRKITLNSFHAVMADYDHKGEPVIKAVRDSGARLGVSELSDGSRDQLFLALRLAGIYRYLDENPPFPFMVDDILINFDDERSQKTLSVLAELSRKTQVIFFTHHGHLVDLASKIPENNLVKIHELADN
ncbi:MAG: AAA family ATPase [Desulfonatronovibrio sp.]